MILSVEDIGSIWSTDFGCNDFESLTHCVDNERSQCSMSTFHDRSESRCRPHPLHHKSRIFFSWQWQNGFYICLGAVCVASIYIYIREYGRIYFYISMELKGQMGEAGKKKMEEEEEEKKPRKEGRFTARESFRSNPSKSIKKISTFQIPAKSADPIGEIPARDRSPSPFFPPFSHSLFFFLLPLFGHF